MRLMVDVESWTGGLEKGSGEEVFIVRISSPVILISTKYPPPELLSARAFLLQSPATPPLHDLLKPSSLTPPPNTSYRHVCPSWLLYQFIMADRLRRPLFYVTLVTVLLSSFYYFFAYYPNHGSPFASFSDSNVDRNTTLRPRIHFTPDRHWMNDPNGLFVDANNLWHLYYQC